MANASYEAEVRKLVAFDQMDIPLSALHNRVDRKHKALAVSLQEPVDENEDFGCAMAEVVYEDKKKAKAIREAVDDFCEQYPVQGRDLRKMIAVKRTARETYFCYGMPEGRRISSQDYMAALKDVGLTEGHAQALYPRLLEVSRTLQRVRGKRTTSSGLRKVLVGTSEL